MWVDYGYGSGNLIGSVVEVVGVFMGLVIEIGLIVDGSYMCFVDGM